MAEMNATIQKLQHRVEELEARAGIGHPVEAPVTPPVFVPAVLLPPPNPPLPRASESNAPPKPLPASQPQPFEAANAPTPAPSDQPASGSAAGGLSIAGTTINFALDTYYGYNFNDPIGRVNRLRAYDILSNAFSLNQASIVIENAPDVEHGKRWGARVDLQFGQATETLQGNAANELRPEVYRNIFQAYGTYVLPVGSGLTVDFGKWASSLGFENNYTQDQINYSRSYWFNFLPYYHMGARLNYQLTKAVALNYWVTNGTQQTEPFNDFKDQFFGLALQPKKSVSWNVNYYLGQEHPNVMFFSSSTDPAIPTEQGQPFLPIANAPKGKLHILDSFASWQAGERLTFGIEADYVVERLMTTSAPQIAWGGAGYSRYQLSPRWAIAGRAEYMADRSGLFSGASQALKETTLTIEQKLAPGFLMREEYRRDFSNQPYFYTDLLGLLKREQNTATIGVVWWSGAKKEPW